MLFADSFNKNEVIKELTTRYIARNIVYMKKTSSTNDLAKENKAMASGTLFIADKQTKGRGRNSRKWVSDSKDGLWFSVLLKPDDSVFEIANITLVAGLSMVKILNELFGEKFMIKWPNDIVSDGKKVSGILCESTKDNNNDIIICGIGINLNQKKFKNEISEIATSVYQKTGKKLKREDFLIRFANLFEEMYEKTLKNGFSYYKDEYKKYSLTLGKDVYLINADKREEAKAIDISNSGELIVEVDGEIRNVFFGEVSVRGIY